ncbi:serine/threonine-protein kinase [Roseomonas sp. WA12]
MPEEPPRETCFIDRAAGIRRSLATVLGVPAEGATLALGTPPSPAHAAEAEALLGHAELHAAEATRLHAAAVLLMVSGDLSALDRVTTLRDEALARGRAGLLHWERAVATLAGMGLAGSADSAPAEDATQQARPLPPAAPAVGPDDTQPAVRQPLPRQDPPLAAPTASRSTDTPAGLRRLIAGSFEFGRESLLLAGRYDIRDAIGRGSFGTVLEAFDQSLHRLVAVKVMAVPPGDAEEQAELRARFRQEARAVGRLSHPGIVPVHDFGEQADTAWLVMDLVIGDTLKSVLDAGEPIPHAEASRITTQLLEALDYAHERDIVHRDIKPANILLTADAGDGLGRVRLVDFGVARLGDSNVTTMGQMVGTLSTMSPEQVRGDEVDLRADLWAVGVVLYHMLTGNRPFRGNQFALMNSILMDEPEPPSRRAAGVPPGYDAVLSRALAKAAEARFPSASAFIAALAEVDGEPASAAEEESEIGSGGVMGALRRRFSRDN